MGAGRRTARMKWRDLSPVQHKYLVRWVALRAEIRRLDGIRKRRRLHPREVEMYRACEQELRREAGFLPWPKQAGRGRGKGKGKRSGRTLYTTSRSVRVVSGGLPGLGRRG